MKILNRTGSIYLAPYGWILFDLDKIMVRSGSDQLALLITLSNMEITAITSKIWITPPA